ncbi:MAG: hypothetical protein KIG68_07085 [Oxalobacter sp.]|nr:hypothetical protein [Oxalobacter sp.]
MIDNGKDDTQFYRIAFANRRLDRPPADHIAISGNLASGQNTNEWERF